MKIEITTNGPIFVKTRDESPPEPVTLHGIDFVAGTVQYTITHEHQRRVAFEIRRPRKHTCQLMDLVFSVKQREKPFKYKLSIVQLEAE